MISSAAASTPSSGAMRRERQAGIRGLLLRWAGHVVDDDRDLEVVGNVVAVGVEPAEVLDLVDADRCRGDHLSIDEADESVVVYVRLDNLNPSGHSPGGEVEDVRVAGLNVGRALAVDR